MKKCFFWLVLLCCLLFLGACSGSLVSEQPHSKNATGTQQEQPVAEIERTLTISVCYNFYNLDIAIERFQKLHPEVEVVLHKYDNDETKYRQQISTQLLSGTADDLLDVGGTLSNPNLWRSGLLADFYPLMENDPAFNEGDYYMNVLEAMSDGENLYEFPLFFSYDLVAVNNTFSPDLVEAYSQLETVSYWDLFDFYAALPDPGGRSVGENFDAASFIEVDLRDFVDFTARACAFDTPEFIACLEKAKEATDPEKIARGELGYDYGFPYTTEEEIAACALQYVFADDSVFMHILDLPYAEPIYTHAIPLTDRNGRIIIRGLKTFSINEASANKDLAWEFLKFLTTPEANADLYSTGFPLHRDLFAKQIKETVSQMVDSMGQRMPLAYETEEAYQQLMTQYHAWNELPMTSSPFLMDLALDARETLYAYYNGSLTAEQTASELQNRFSLYLKE